MKSAQRSSPPISAGFIACPVCGRIHRSVPLRFGERALCVDCETALPHTGPDGMRGLCYTLTALILAVPAVVFPIVSVNKFGAASSSYLWTGAQALWKDGMPLLAVWVALCGIVIPCGLLAALVLVSLARLSFGRGMNAPLAGGPPAVQPASPRASGVALWVRLAHAFQHWSMPEVHVLAVLIAFIKIGVLVNVEPGAGLWFYSAMAVALLLAWRNTDLGEARP